MDDIERGVSRTSLQRITTMDEKLVWRLIISSTEHFDLTETASAAASADNYGPDADHVHLPSYALNGSMARWKTVQTALKRLMKNRVDNGDELKDLILSYNGKYSSKWDFDGLLLFCNNLERYEWLELRGILGDMANLAFGVEQTVLMPIPYLKRGMNASIALSKKQIACLLAHAFFCTFPLRNAESSESFPFPSINFSSLFRSDDDEVTESKLKCIIHYFKRVTNKMPSGQLVFKRQSVTESVQWRKSKTRFTELHVTSYGSIESEKGLLQVDFANKYVGGGVLSGGCVQEEILFLISPELIVSRLFTEVLEDNEVLIVTGSEIFSRHDGYSDTFEWKGNYVDSTSSANGVKLTQIVAMDAKNFYRGRDQFEVQEIDRELNKAYSGFYSGCKVNSGVRLPAVSTGNWGCGAFGGDKHLKSLIQMMAAAEAGRDVCYFTYGDNDLVEKMSQVHQNIRSGNLTVGDVYNIILAYVKELKGHRNYSSLLLYDYMLRR